jgi:hypothetical protein
LIPDQAVGTSQDQKYVFTVNEADHSNKVEMHTVQLGPIVDGLRVIRSGINSNDWVVINGLMMLGPGVVTDPTNEVLTASAASGANH